jgi:hypothetical protein
MIVCCVQWGNYCDRGAQYVNILYQGVRRNLLRAFDFVCFTDDPSGLDDGIQARPMPVGDIPGWWNKLALFKPGVFPAGERVLFLDLDTLIVGSLDEIAEYKGQFAILRDFYFPQQIGPGVMLWEPSAYTASIWQEWDNNGRPAEHEWGDLWWINSLDQGHFAQRTDKLQDLFPGRFVSYKTHCRARLPADASVVCFHGEPRPHQIRDGWVREAWRVNPIVHVRVRRNFNELSERV